MAISVTVVLEWKRSIQCVTTLMMVSISPDEPMPAATPALNAAAVACEMQWASKVLFNQLPGSLDLVVSDSCF